MRRRPCGSCTGSKIYLLRKLMKLHFGLIAVCLGTASGQDWKLLFDGKTMNGWQSHWAESWKIQVGALFRDASAPSSLSTTDSFSDYFLKLEFRGAEKVQIGEFL